MHKKLILTAVMLFAIGFSVPAVTAEHAGQGLEQHCPDHQGNPGKVGAGQSPKTITVDGEDVTVTISGENVEFTDSNGDPIKVEFCIKAGPLAGGVQEGSSGEVTWVNHGGNTPDISYVVVYSLVEEEPEEPEEPKEPETPVVPETSGGVTGGGFQEIQKPTEKPQAQAPSAGVNAGGSTSTILASIGALGTSIASLGYGLLRLRKFGA